MTLWSAASCQGSSSTAPLGSESILPTGPPPSKRRRMVNADATTSPALAHARYRAVVVGDRAWAERLRAPLREARAVPRVQLQTRRFVAAK